MSSFAILLLCIQACLVQNVFSQCLGAYGPATTISPAAALGAAGLFGCGAGLTELAYPGTGFGAYPGASLASAVPGLAPYGGEGNVAVAGELPVAGNT